MRRGGGICCALTEKHAALTVIAKSKRAESARITIEVSVSPPAARSRRHHSFGESRVFPYGLLREPEIDGALVGGASLQAQTFLGIVKKAAFRGGNPKE